jgi:hypothetical protein
MCTHVLEGDGMQGAKPVRELPHDGVRQLAPQGVMPAEFRRARHTERRQRGEVLAHRVDTLE